MRCLAFAVLLGFAPALLGDDAGPVPQAVKALEYLKPRADAGPNSWTAGEYHYDGAGNITTIGNEAFVYDKLGRLRNRLSALEYDASGNVITSGAQHYDYDAVGMPNTVRLGSNLQPRVIYAYTADDERLFAFDVSTGTTHWILRGFDNKVLRDFRQQGTTWSVDRDYVYRDGLLLAALKSNGAAEHYTLDHLGTPRLITDATGHKIGLHAYWPFGEEWTPATAQEGNPLQFTGHERDIDPSNDYMHARYYRAGWGRFLAADPVRGVPAKPQTWNRYSYALNNPVLHNDPTGRCIWDGVWRRVRLPSRS